MDIRAEDYEEIDELARARELIRIEEMRNRIHERDDTPYQNLVPCKSCGKACAPRDNGLCVFCDCAPAQEEKEMPIETINMPDDDFDMEQEEKAALARSLERRWDKAFFAALTSCSCSMAPDRAVLHSQQIANEAIRRHAELMDSRDAVIAEVVG